MTKDTSNLIVGLDIGTTKVTAAVGELGLDGGIRVIGLGQSESKGIKKGVVVNIEATVESIHQAIEQAELSSRCKIKNVYVGIGGNHIKSFNSEGMVATKDREVSASDVSRVIETAKAVNIPHDQQLLHVIPQEFIIDGNDDVREPIGMTGKRLEVNVHIVTGAISAVQNIVKCVHRQGLSVSDLIFQPFASAEAVLTPDEKELGVVFVDIGGGTTDVAIFYEGAVRHTAIIPVAGDQITSDIAMAFRTPSVDAELIKVKHGTALPSSVRRGEQIDVPGIANQPPTRICRNLLAEVIEARMEETLMMVRQVIEESGFSNMVARGVVITGGSAQLQGVEEIALGVFNKPVRMAAPLYTGPMQEVMQHPRYATVLGLLIEGQKQMNRHALLLQRSSPSRIYWHKLKDWFFSNF